MIETGIEERDGLCGICPAGCWIRARLRDGALESVEPLPDHPLGILCRIGRSAPEIVHDPDRLRFPLRRNGPKGTHAFERISWEEAYDLLVGKLQGIKEAYGAEAAAIYTGRGSFDMAMCDLFQPQGVAVSSASSVLFPFGSPNTLGVGALCYVSFAMIAPHVTLGEMYVTMDVDIEQAELIVIWGANPATDSPPLAHRQILEARRRGAEVIAIDPRRNGTAKEADAEWIAVRPGTDGALALGMIQVLLEEELYDERFVADWTVGFDGLKNLVRHYRPEMVETITGVAAETVRATARRIASARGATPIMYTGLEYSDSGVQAIRAVFTLWALAGQLDVPGGLLIRMRENAFPQNRRHLIANPDLRKALGRERFPVYSRYRGESHAIALPDAVLKGDPYKIRALIVLGGSIITSWPDPDLWRRTFEALDFSVCINRYHTADSAYADLVLPATTQFETTSYMRYGPLFKIREKMLEPVGEARNDFLILAELARRLGYGHLYPQSEEEILEKALEGTGFTVAAVRQAGGSVRVPTVMREYKKWQKGSLRPDGLPLVFNSGTRTPYDFRSQHHGVRGLGEFHPEPEVLLHPDDAAPRGIRDGDPVWVETLRGRVRLRARLSGDIVRGAVDAAMGGGGPLGPESWQQANVNALTDPEHYDPISGFPVYKTLLCQVSRALGTRGAAAPLPGEETGMEKEKDPAAGTEPVQRVYLDHNATTPVDSEVLEAMLPFLKENWGNPSSIHALGRASRTPLENARRQVAQMLNCTARRILFTGSGSEADNLAIRGILPCRPGRHLITSAVEHPAVLQTCLGLGREGYEVTVLPVDGQGRVCPESLAEALRPDTALVSIMLANNETGTLQPVAELAAVARRRKVPFHTDAVQALGKIPLDVEELGVDLLSLSAHKIGGPKGVGALYVRSGLELAPLITGGGQEHGLRSGTENVAGIVGFGKACEVALRRLNAGEMARLAHLRDRLEAGICYLLPDARRNGPEEDRLPNTLNLTLPEIRGESLVLSLDRRGVFFSSGSACKSGNPEPSPALLAMGLSVEEAHCAVRFSLGTGNSAEDIDYVLSALEKTLAETRSAIRFVSCR